MKASQVYRLLIDAGFPRAAAVTMTAISGAETGGRYDPNAIGDTALENRTWGPSVGLFQIRTLKAATGTGGPRDITKLRGNAVAQAQAAHAIWAGSGFHPWSTYGSGAYKGYLPTATKAGRTAKVGAVAANVQPAGWLNSGGLLNPLNWPGAIGGAAGKAAGSATGAVWGEVQPFLLTGMFAVAGLALVVVGITVTAKPTIDAASERVDRVRQDAAKAAEGAAVVA